MAVLCPPHLCEQWQEELRSKFHIEAVVIRSGTASKLERGVPNGSNIFAYYRHIIVSLDYAKSERRRGSLISSCPDFVIVDEAHTCTRGMGRGSSQQQRHQLIAEVAGKGDRHLVLLTATPHSGIEESFLSLLGLLQREFAELDLENLTDEERDKLAGHFIQRRRADVRRWLGDDTPFPEREGDERTYRLSGEYKDLFDKVYSFARGLVKTVGEEMSYAQRRGRYWSALALIRCVMSSPAAAMASLGRQVNKDGDEDRDDEFMGAYVYDPTDLEGAVDVAPGVTIEGGEKTYGQADKRQLRAFRDAAARLQGDKDEKLQTCIKYVQDLLASDYHPIIWCRYIATANYLANYLANHLPNNLNGRLEGEKSQVRVVAITGEMSEDEREIRLDELKSYPQRVLVATDCLSEGVNLQSHFSAVIHYDLPWNPNRLEQREGRVDRYGQVTSKVKSCLIYGQDNPVDGAVLKVLIQKAREIHKTLGVYVPVPMDSAALAEAVFKSLFDGDAVRQLSLLNLDHVGEDAINEVHNGWDRAVERERVSRTRFAQRAIKPEEVEAELSVSDDVLGGEEDVARFVKNACERLHCSLRRRQQGWWLPKPDDNVPDFLKSLLGSVGSDGRLISFSTPTPRGVEYVGRNHVLVEGLARYILQGALTRPQEAIAARCGLTVTDRVSRRTTLLLLRLRHWLKGAKECLLAEECCVLGFTGSPSQPMWLEPVEARALLEGAKPVGNAFNAREEMADLLARMGELKEDLEKFAYGRSQFLWESHQRVRKITKEGRVKVSPQLPMDLLGVYVLLPGR